MMPAPVLVVIVNYNSGQRLADCVADCLEQAEQVLVVDNGSRDDSLRRTENRFDREDGRLRILRNNANLGFSRACNIGAEAAEGRPVLFLNPDCRLQPEALARMMAALDDDPRAGMAGGLLLNLDGSEQMGGRRAVPTPWRSLVRVLHLSRFADRWPRLFADFNLHLQPLPPAPIEVEAISGSCTLVTPQAMRDVGPWDESYFLHCEDLDLCMRYRRRGWKILFVPTARVIHDQGACGRSRPVFVEWNKHRGMIRFYRKFFRHQYPWGLMGLVIFGVWLRFCGVLGYIVFRRLSARRETPDG